MSSPEQTLGQVCPGFGFGAAQTAASQQAHLPSLLTLSALGLSEQGRAMLCLSGPLEPGGPRP